MDSERVIAGHRVLRLLARGDRSQVWLAAGDIVLKVLDRPLAAGQPGSEARALHAARGEHVVELLDASMSDDEVVLVFPRLPRGSLATLLASGRGLDAGEAVTILAPLAGCLAGMHEGGVAHGALSPTHVMFRGDGAPVGGERRSRHLALEGHPRMCRHAMRASIHPGTRVGRADRCATHI